MVGRNPEELAVEYRQYSMAAMKYVESAQKISQDNKQILQDTQRALIEAQEALSKIHTGVSGGSIQHAKAFEFLKN